MTLFRHTLFPFTRILTNQALVLTAEVLSSGADQNDRCIINEYKYVLWINTGAIHQQVDD